MPNFDDYIKNGTPLGLAIGLGAAALATVIIPALPALVRAGKPTARAAIKSGLVLLERGREVMSEASEELDDIMAEVKAELQKERQAVQSEFTDTEVIIKTRNEK